MSSLDQLGPRRAACGRGDGRPGSPNSVRVRWRSDGRDVASSVMLFMYRTWSALHDGKRNRRRFTRGLFAPCLEVKSRVNCGRRRCVLRVAGSPSRIADVVHRPWPDPIVFVVSVGMPLEGVPAAPCVSRDAFCRTTSSTSTSSKAAPADARRRCDAGVGTTRSTSRRALRNSHSCGERRGRQDASSQRERAAGSVVRSGDAGFAPSAGRVIFASALWRMRLPPAVGAHVAPHRHISVCGTILTHTHTHRLGDVRSHFGPQHLGTRTVLDASMPRCAMFSCRPPLSLSAGTSWCTSMIRRSSPRS